MDRWKDNGYALETATILTFEPNEMIEQVGIEVWHSIYGTACTTIFVVGTY